MTVWIQNPFDNLPPEGFRKQRYWLMSEAFAAAGHRTIYFTSDFSHASKAPRRFKHEPTGLPFELRLIPTVPYPRNVCLGRVRSHRAYARTWERLAAGLPRPDVIVSSIPSISAAVTALELARRHQARAVIDIMDAWPETFERLFPARLGRLFTASLRHKVHRLYREADLVTGVAERYRDLSGREDYYLAYHGMESAGRPADRPTGQSDDQTVLRLVYAGNTGRTYDLATILQAVEDNPDFSLDIAGAVPEEFRAFNHPRVRWHGYLERQALDRLLSGSDIGIIPMKDDSWVGMPYKICDYAVNGLRIVSSLGGESAALLEKYACGATYRPGDSVSLAAAIRRAATLRPEASRTLFDRELDAAVIYPAYVRRIEALI